MREREREEGGRYVIESVRNGSERGRYVIKRRTGMSMRGIYTCMLNERDSYGLERGDTSYRGTGLS